MTHVTTSKDVNRIASFLLRNSDGFVPPLADRVEIYEYSNKLVNKATNIFLTENGIDVGHAAIYHNLPLKAFLTSFCIDHAHHRRGLGNRLMIEVINECVTRYIPMLELEVALKNKRAYAFYRYHDFQELRIEEKKILMFKEIY